MKVVREILGNFHEDKEWTKRLSGAAVEWLMLDHHLIEKKRLEARTSSGKEILVVLEDNALIKDGDVLDWDKEKDRALIVRLVSRKDYEHTYDNSQKAIGCSKDEKN